jgi:hypothetical protein
MARRKSNEEKVAERIEGMINDLTLDIEQVGLYLARSNGTTYRRFIEISESAKYEKKDKTNDYQY